LPSCALQRWGVSKKAPQSANLQICGLIFFRFADRPQMGNFRICDLRTINFLRFAIRGPISCWLETSANPPIHNFSSYK
jgi:hypothetical protein